VPKGNVLTLGSYAHGMVLASLTPPPSYLQQHLRALVQPEPVLIINP
jgi:hypothetical protein